VSSTGIGVFIPMESRARLKRVTNGSRKGASNARPTRIIIAEAYRKGLSFPNLSAIWPMNIGPVIPTSSKKPRKKPTVAGLYPSLRTISCR